MKPIVYFDNIFNSIIVINMNVMKFIDLYACTYKYFNVRINVSRILVSVYSIYINIVVPLDCINC